ncbi:MAG: late competence development ComFB family protein [Defluviitaleaceae bacterium]|nr:late competence development ComFB family protein [Defluviitaleaceae bacterium]
MDIKIRNYMEDLVNNMIDGVLSDVNCCTCEKCRCDVMAIALNSLPPKYIVTTTGQLYTKLNTLRQQFEVDIIAALTKAAVIVGRNPRHDRTE